LTVKFARGKLSYMEKHPLLIENKSKRLNFRLSLLVCFAMFCAWQMGMIYFSTQTLSVHERVVVPASEDVVAVIIACGYLLSILVMIFLPRVIVWTVRITTGVALLSALALYAPLSPQAFALALYIQFFCCCFMIGFETALIVNLFTVKTAIVHLTVAYAVALCIAALLQNDFVKTPFWIFRYFAVAACALQLLFYCKLPARVWPRYAKKSDNLVCPKSFFAGVYVMELLTALLSLFGIAIAETVKHGVFIYYLSSAICAVVVFTLWKHCGIVLMRCASVLIGIAALGFMLAIASLSFPALSIVACVLLGTGFAALGMMPLYGVILAKHYPSRFIATTLIGFAFTAILIHMFLLEALRDNPVIMYTVYLVIAAALAVLFFMLMPYLLYSYRSRTLQDIIGVIAEDQDESIEPVTEQPSAMLQTAKARTPLLRTAAKTEAAPQPEEPLHARRMKILLKHALSPLTRREYQAADCIMRGLRRAEIAQEMDVLPDSVTKYINRIYDKFGIHRRQDLFRLAETLDREWGDAE